MPETNISSDLSRLSRSRDEPRGRWTMHASTPQRLAALLLLILFFAGLGLLLARHPSELAPPLCPTRTILDLDCPGCGGTRATHHLLNGRFEPAFRQNPVVAILGVPAMAIVVVVLGMTIMGRLPRLAPWERLLLVLLVLLILFGIARNIPLGAFEWMRTTAETTATTP